MRIRTGPRGGGRGRAADIARNTAVLLGILLATILITELLRSYLSFAQHILVLLYVLSVMVISCLCPGYVYGLIAAVVSALVCDFLIVTPRLGFSFSVGSPVTLLALLLITTITSTLTSRLRKQEQLAQSRQQHFELLYEINRELVSARSVGAIADIVTGSLESRTGRPVIVHLSDPEAGAPQYSIRPTGEAAVRLFINESEFGKVHALFQDPEAPGEEGRVFYLPIRSDGAVTGVIGLGGAENPVGPEEHALTETLAVQVALALDLQLLSDRQAQLAVNIEKEKTRSTLLRAISHDFRTPVAAIRGACSAMLEQPDLPKRTREKLLRDMLEDADWLSGMAENILTATRISGEAPRISEKEEAAEEVVAYAVSIVRKRCGRREIRIKVPDELLLVPMDGGLIAQVLINLLENAVLHSDSDGPVRVELRREGDRARFDVLDHGRGIPACLAAGLFQDGAAPELCRADASRGWGLGLSICKTIVDAHHGTIEARQAPGGGSLFSFWLPLEGRADAV